jgi:hypothetical protein
MTADTMEDRPTRQELVTNEEIEKMLHDKNTKEFEDLRDRAAYVYVTGSFPTHLRTYMTALLRKLTRYSRTPVSLDRRLGSMQIAQENIVRLGLEDHPLVRKVREYIDKGYQIQLSREDFTTRRPYTKVFMYKRVGMGFDRVTVQYDGSIKDEW